MRNYTKYGGILGLILIIIGLINYSMSGFWEISSIALIVVGILLGIIYFITNIRKTVEVMGRRDTKYGGNALASIISILGILVLINFVINKRNHRFDLTAAKQFSLSPQTIKVLKGLKTDVDIKSFFRGERTAGKEAVEDLLAEFVNVSKRVKYEFIDPDKNPAIVKKYEVTSYGTTVIECGDKIERITTTIEQDFTNAITKASREKMKVIYFTEGHGEKDIDGYEKDGYNFIKEALQGENYEVKKIFIAREDSIPEDCAALVSIGPTKEFFPAELDTIDAFINKGGKVFSLLDPEPSPGMNEFFEKWGVKVRNDIVLDFSGIGRLFGAGPGMPLVNEYGYHAITNDFRGIATFFPMVRSVARMDSVSEDLEVVELVKTTQNSYGETKLGKDDTPEFNEGEDTPGPLSLAVAVSKILPSEVTDETIIEDIPTKEKSGRLVVFGDSDFSSNSFARMQGNMDLFLNVIDWLAEEEELISIRARNPEDRRLNLTEKQTMFFRYFSMFFLPAIVIISGITIYAKRRKL